ncbi:MULTISPECIES: quinone-dependent dihydroorotate dehydrogenase [Photobacterium]|uniref:Dihydroorotate dehydrogenase (quinone) n=1 Tax=Photobacterium leiognathi TaxID=553611 RepID=A0ABX5GJ67_PHOLE|nr:MULTISPECIES: quinone-dependent dihydroorotate dehydrogenase [Photobacterium]MBP2700328.1 quinone-dependent dihydroorotate dehydrogenase [Vibrio parahaemolyticus]KJF91375.1 dihydroorotate dehydrogenase [Photobacterium leiognathi]KPA51116.1 dihydroorotate dehydrogenase [Photobacterium leiognathi subsp. mandapamensis]MZG55547.1 quinone-dependent dihydroorotate dehydrogenase [Photobacterium lucens]MZG80655.1 quinone-dependent dihydroorotate dehydrogenase [Photobacterium lucens]
MLYRIARSAIFQLDAEKAHDLAIENFSRFTGTPLDLFYRQHLPERPVEVMGLTFKNPVGLAAGLDKNGECIDAFGAMGFGFVEVGTVTPRPQPGNDKPRLFRLIPAEGIINRFGFNNLGVDNLVENVKKAKYDGIIGINIGKNKDTPIEKGAEDYLICMDKVYQYAGYIAVNISSPNTPGLRSLQYGEALDDLLSQLKEKQAELAEKHGKYVPLALKIAPDLDDHEILQVCDSLIRNKIDGVIGTNTTLDRSLVQGMEHCDEVGGLSGRPLQNKSTEVIRKMAEALKGEIPIIGVGGIDSAISAREKMMAGASLVQVYSGFIYHGPRLVKDIVNGL